jgi:hypothetical protein
MQDDVVFEGDILAGTNTEGLANLFALLVGVPQPTRSVDARNNASPRPPPKTMNSHENLYDKLNNVHASLRKEKEDAHRTKQLAEQRLQLARADREAMEKRGAETRAQLQRLKERTIEMKSTNAAMENENKLLEKEVCVFRAVHTARGTYFYHRKLPTELVCCFDLIPFQTSINHTLPSSTFNTRNFKVRRKSSPAFRISVSTRPTVVITR